MLTVTRSQLFIIFPRNFRFRNSLLSTRSPQSSTGRSTDITLTRNVLGNHFTVTLPTTSSSSLSTLTESSSRNVNKRRLTALLVVSRFVSFSLKSNSSAAVVDSFSYFLSSCSLTGRRRFQFSFCSILLSHSLFVLVLLSLSFYYAVPSPPSLSTLVSVYSRFLLIGQVSGFSDYPLASRLEFYIHLLPVSLRLPLPFERPRRSVRAEARKRQLSTPCEILRSSPHSFDLL